MQIKVSFNVRKKSRKNTPYFSRKIARLSHFRTVKKEGSGVVLPLRSSENIKNILLYKEMIK